MYIQDTPVFTENKSTFDSDYLALLTDVLNNGTKTQDRTSVGSSIQTFGKVLTHKFEYDTEQQGYTLPFCQIRKFGPKLAFEEYSWMMHGSTDVTELQNKNIHIWDGNSTREFLDARGLQHVPTNNIGKAYGYQFRNLPHNDQIKNLVHNLKTNPTSRRHLVNIWNPQDLSEMALEPCSYAYNFVVIGNELNLIQHMRSTDVLFGLPYNFAFGSYFLLALCALTSLKPGKISITMGNAHIYENQVPIVLDMIHEWVPKVDTLVPAIGKFNKHISTFDQFISLEYKDFGLHRFSKGPEYTKVEMAV